MNGGLSVFQEGQLEALSKALGDCASGSDITRILQTRGIPDRSGESTKWRRLYFCFAETQAEYGSPNKVLGFVEALLAPARFVGKSEEYEEHRARLNAVLAFSGIELGKDGRLRKCSTAKTLSEAERRLKALQNRLRGRSIHPEVQKYCRSELLQENYFHAVFEAAKGLAQRIREMSGCDGDGAKLVDAVFSVERPVLAMNSLRTETEKSEHKGFSQLLRGCFAAVRNPLAHEPKILWQGEEDAADYFSLISLLHRRLDECVVVPAKSCP